jgi:hypothetical protein
MLAIILNANQTKEGKKRRKKRIAGCWRHKHYLRCATGSVALAVFSGLYFKDDLNFYAGRQGQKPMWWKHDLSFGEWRDTRVAGTAYNRVLTDCNVSWGKVVHMRAAGIEHASAIGQLDAAAVSTLSKHQKSNLDKVYMTELFGPVLRVMAGFSASDNLTKTNPTIYHVPRALIELPWPADEVAKFVFPKIDIWRMQHESPQGDKSEAARNFLYGVLPFFANVVAQDGIYWVKDYPNHEISKLILEVMPPDYERWAHQMRQKIIDDQKNDNEILTSSLNEGAKAALLAVKESINIKMNEMKNSIETLNSKMNEFHQMQQQLIAATNATGVVAVNGQTNVQTNVQNEPIRMIMNDPAQVQPPPRLFTDVMRNTGKFPVFPSSLPNDVNKLMVEYKNFNLEQWEMVKMTTWEAKIRQAYSRRKYTNNLMKARAMLLRNGTFEQRLIRTADNMDAERISHGFSVARYIEFLKANDPNVKTRKRKRAT